MREFREAWNEMVVETTSPNGLVRLRNLADREIQVRIDDSYFHRTGLVGLVEQAVRLLKLAFVERTRTYNRTRELLTGIQVGPIEPGDNPHVQEFVRRRDEMVAEGTSADGLVNAVSMGMREFTVTIDPTLWSGGDRAAVERGLGEACTAALRDQFAKMQQLKREGH